MWNTGATLRHLFQARAKQRLVQNQTLLIGTPMTDATRSPAAVLDDHLRESQTGSVEADLARNYSEDLVVLTGRGVYRGHEGLKQLARILREELPDATFEYRTRLVQGEMGFLEWTGRSPMAEVEDGADSYLIRDGKIVAQTIHYMVKHRSNVGGGQQAV
jgi:hypothetical protein